MEIQVVQHNRSSPSRIVVCVRLRPVIQEDNIQAHKSKNDSPDICVHLKPDGQSVKLCRDLYTANFFSVDHTFAPTVTQSDVYNLSMRKVVQDVIQGYNGTGMVYGQTGSGKSHTMFGSGKQPGIVQMAMDDIFNAVINQEESDLLGKVYMSFYQIYVEHIYDLLTDHKVLTPLQIREDAKRGTHVENLQLMYLKDRQTAHDLLEYGLKGRRTQSTSQNILSSRSHAVLRLHLDFEETNEFSNPLAEDGDVEDSQLYSTIYQKRHTVRRSVLTLVDLAGSERVKHYSRTISKQQFKEAVVINKSISALGNCIQALANNHSAIQHSQWVNNTSSGNMSVNSGSTASAGVHIPFRDCKLTRLLAEPLGGNSKTVIIANIGPCQCNAEETLSTLKFATRAMVVRKQVRKEALQEVIERLPVVTSPIVSALREEKDDEFGAELVEEDWAREEEVEEITNSNEGHKMHRSPASRYDDYEGDEEEGEVEGEDDDTADYLRANTSSYETPLAAPLPTVSYLATIDPTIVPSKTTFNLREFLASCQRQHVDGFRLLGETVSPSPVFQQSAVDRLREINPSHMWHNVAMLPLSPDRDERRRKSYRGDSESVSGCSVNSAPVMPTRHSSRSPLRVSDRYNSPQRVAPPTIVVAPQSVSPLPRKVQPEWQSPVSRGPRAQLTSISTRRENQKLVGSSLSSAEGTPIAHHSRNNSSSKKKVNKSSIVAQAKGASETSEYGMEERKHSEADFYGGEAHADMFNHVRRNEVRSRHQTVSSSPRHKPTVVDDVDVIIEEARPENLVLELPVVEPIIPRISTTQFDEIYSPVRPQFTPRKTRTHSGDDKAQIDRSSSPAPRAHQPPKMFSPLLLSGSYDELMSELNKVCDDAVTQLSVGKPTVAGTPSRDGSASTTHDRLVNLTSTPTTLTFSPKIRTPVMRTIRSFPQSMPTETSPQKIAVEPSLSPSSTEKKTPRSSAPTPRPESQDEAELWYATQRERSQLSALVSRLKITPEDIAAVTEVEGVVTKEVAVELVTQEEIELPVVGEDTMKTVEVEVVEDLQPSLPSPAANDTDQIVISAVESPTITTISSHQPIDEQQSVSVVPIASPDTAGHTPAVTVVLDVDTNHTSLSPLFAVKSKRKAPPTPMTASPMDASRLAHSDSAVKSSRSAGQRRRNTRSVEEARLELLASFSRERLVVMIVQLQDELESRDVTLAAKVEEIAQLKKYILEM